MKEAKVYWVAAKDGMNNARVNSFVLITNATSVGYLSPARGENFMTLSIQFFTNIFYPNESSALVSVLEHRSHLVDDIRSGSWQKHRIMPPCGSDALFEKELGRRSLNYNRNVKGNPPFSTAHDECGGWIASLFEAAGVPAVAIRTAGTFWGRDFTDGRSVFPVELFSDQTPQPVIPPDTSQPQEPSPGNGQRIHIVQSGDWLSKIAITYYGDMNRWPEIYKANADTIGPKPNVLIPGQQLIIP